MKKYFKEKILIRRFPQLITFIKQFKFNPYRVTICRTQPRWKNNIMFPEHSIFVRLFFSFFFLFFIFILLCDRQCISPSVRTGTVKRLHKEDKEDKMHGLRDRVHAWKTNQEYKNLSIINNLMIRTNRIENQWKKWALWDYPRWIVVIHSVHVEALLGTDYSARLLTFSCRRVTLKLLFFSSSCLTCQSQYVHQQGWNFTQTKGHR